MLILSIFLTIFTQVLTIKINSFVVPEIVQSGALNSVVLGCDYSSDEECSVQWRFNRSEGVYEWTPGIEPVVSGILDGHVDFRSISNEEEYRNIHIVDLVPELSGDYTCKVVCKDGTEASQTKSMLVYSPERDIELKITEHPDSIEVKCYVGKVYPQPELSLELSSQIIPKQQQRVWRSEDKFFDAESTAMLPMRVRNNANITCRLSLPQAGYMAMKMDVCIVPKQTHNAARTTSTNHCIVILVLITLFNKINVMLL